VVRALEGRPPEDDRRPLRDLVLELRGDGAVATRVAQDADARQGRSLDPQAPRARAKRRRYAAHSIEPLDPGEIAVDRELGRIVEPDADAHVAGGKRDDDPRGFARRREQVGRDVTLAEETVVGPAVPYRERELGSGRLRVRARRDAGGSRAGSTARKDESGEHADAPSARPVRFGRGERHRLVGARDPNAANDSAANLIRVGFGAVSPIQSSSAERGAIVSSRTRTRIPRRVRVRVSLRFLDTS
jgi:hypothetical protein